MMVRKEGGDQFNMRAGDPALPVIDSYVVL